MATNNPLSRHPAAQQQRGPRILDGDPETAVTLPASASQLLGAVEACLDLAVEHCLATQRPDGSWETLPDPRIFETALCGYALAHTPGDLDQSAVRRARHWVSRATPQRHSPIEFLLEDTLRRILLGEGGGVDLRAPELATPVMAKRCALLHTLALHAGLEVRAHHTEEDLRRQVTESYHRCAIDRLKQWSKVELIATHILLQSRAGNDAAVQAAGFDLLHVQAPRAGFFFNPVSTALAYIALCIAAPASDPWFILRERLVEDQQPDGTWRFCSSDVWDTSLIVRAFHPHPGFARHGLAPAVDFLQAVQNPDGGWPFRSNVESDNDTTGAVILALRGTLQGERTIDRALAYLARVQLGNGLWRTWYFRDDPPVADVVAHVLSALDAYAARHRLSTVAARAWLAEEIERGGWAASWYRGVPYAVAEVGRALGPASPVLRRGAAVLAAAQNEDGGWSPELTGPSTPSATGQALSALVDHHPECVDAALRYLVTSQRADGTWPGTPDMYGPRPLLSHFPTHTHAFVVGGIMAALERGWPRLRGRGEGER